MTTEITRTIPPDPEGMNDERARLAGLAIEEFINESNTPRDCALVDLLGDLMHWADRNGEDFEAELYAARRHYAEETKS